MNYPCDSDKSRCCLCTDKEVAGKPHAACCMCGRQTLKPAPYNYVSASPVWIDDPIPIWPGQYQWLIPQNGGGTSQY